ATGAAYLAGIQAGLWKKDRITNNRKIEKRFTPDMPEALRTKLYKGWQKAIERTMKWID
ncbi:MAG: glycerol kinase, partial [Cytophagia bacterium]|nr:glycerol kinase [Cytophagia bacterium]